MTSEDWLGVSASRRPAPERASPGCCAGPGCLEVLNRLPTGRTHGGWGLYPFPQAVVPNLTERYEGVPTNDQAASGPSRAQGPNAYEAASLADSCQRHRPIRLVCLSLLRRPRRSADSRHIGGRQRLSDVSGLNPETKRSKWGIAEGSSNRASLHLETSLTLLPADRESPSPGQGSIECTSVSGNIGAEAKRQQPKSFGRVLR